MTEHTETPQRRNSIRRLLPDEEIPPGVPARYVSSHGYIVTRTADPETIPIKLVTGWWFLRADGTKLPTTRPETTYDE